MCLVKESEVKEIMENVLHFLRSKKIFSSLLKVFFSTAKNDFLDLFIFHETSYFPSNKQSLSCPTFPCLQ